jgi:hypothetical protein
MRSLTTLAKNHNLTTIILNAVTAGRSNSDNIHNMPGATRTSWHDDENNKSAKEWDFPSIFMDNTMRPALGKTFTYFLDLHVLLSVLPKSRRDVELMHSTQTSFNHRIHNLKPDIVNILEVLSDRYAGRVGKWAAFAVEGGVRLSTRI